ncbi:low temperature requirement protein A [Micromonospora globispora]|uniref:Low temperature requirement protein A n=1 Tax=Micromonospora globispora TaxID=1450148 RepID=A0A317KDH5_9ACTN|nr:low temperature requirement protein A [Micromonospora globispora]PWU51356.1 low temperature requirement protein A [Micromonospora globispora]RQX01733.1 low temperature requirement protein A [Micromonospora globispora]
MTSGAAGLLRRPEEPRATYLELFFDLVFVFALARLSQGLLDQLTWSDAFQTLVLLLALWTVWTHTAGLTERLNPHQPLIELLVIATMFGTLLMAAAAPEAFGEHGLVFAGLYVATQIGRSAAAVLLLRGHEARGAFARPLFWNCVSAVPWIAGAVAHDTARAVLWALAVTVEYGALIFGFPTPRLGRARAAEFAISAPHLAERYRQLFIIALGELILVTGFTFSRGRFEPDRIAAVVVAFTTTALLWRIYIHRAGRLLAEAIAAAPDPFRAVIPANYANLLMVAGIVAIAVGDELVIDHPLGHTPPAWITVILGGPALFLAGRGMFEYTVFGRISRSRPIGVLVLAAISPAAFYLPPLLVAIAPALVLAGIAISDAARARGRPPEPPSPPGPN